MVEQSLDCDIDEIMFHATEAQNGHTNTQTSDTLRFQHHQMITDSGNGNAGVTVALSSAMSP